jgi:TPR repeat protein
MSRAAARSVAPILLLILAATAAAAADDVAEGLAAYERGDYAAALAAWLPLAKRGDAEAQYRVGRLYYYGTGVAPDAAEAARWYRAAAEQGHARSQSNLGALYEEGRGVPADPAAAAAWYSKAAAQGRAVASLNLGRMYEQGRGVAQDDRKAFELYEAAAKKGDAEAQWHLARMYEDGRGVAADADQASKWERRAIKNGYQPGTAGTASPVAAIAADDAPPSAPAGAPADAPVVAGGAATPPDSLLSAAEAGDAEAQYQLGNRYRLGAGVAEDSFEAASWYRRAAEQGHGMAMYMLGYLHYRGRVEEHRSLVSAYVWFARAAELGVGDAAEWAERIDSRLTRAERNEALRRLHEAADGGAKKE